MAKLEKKTASQKIVEKLTALTVVSAKKAEIEKVVALTDNVEVKNFILSTEKRYNDDILYLRSQIIYQAKKVADEMTVDQFSKFADGLQKLLS